MRLEVFDIVLGVLYMVIVVIELFGIVSAFLVRLSPCWTSILLMHCVGI